MPHCQGQQMKTAGLPRRSDMLPATAWSAMRKSHATLRTSHDPAARSTHSREPRCRGIAFWIATGGECPPFPVEWQRGDAYVWNGSISAVGQSARSYRPLTCSASPKMNAKTRA